MLIQSWFLLGILGIHSIEDIRDRRITVTLSLFSGIVGLMLHLIFFDQTIFSMLCGILTGIFLLGFSKVSRGVIGMGDGIVFMVTGLFVGFYNNLILMFLSFSFAGICAVSLLFMGKVRKMDRLPFVPFLFAAYSMMCITGRG